MNDIKTIDLLKALNSETKLVILYFLMKKKDDPNKMCVKKLAEITERNIKNISKQLLELQKINILTSVKDNQKVFYQYNKNLPSNINKIISKIIEFYSNDIYKCPCISNELKRRKNERI